MLKLVHSSVSIRNRCYMFITSHLLLTIVDQLSLRVIVTSPFILLKSIIIFSNSMIFFLDCFGVSLVPCLEY